jgi:hypothetical protein
MRPGSGKEMPFTAILGCLSDLVWLRLSHPQQSRPAPNNEGTQDSSEQRRLCREYMAMNCSSPVSR